MSDKRVTLLKLCELAVKSRNKRAYQVQTKELFGLTYDLSGTLYDLVRSRRFAEVKELWREHRRNEAEFKKHVEELNRREALEREEEKRQVKAMRDNISKILNELVAVRMLLQKANEK
jgi:hypothetical protein